MPRPPSEWSVICGYSISGLRSRKSRRGQRALEKMLRETREMEEEGSEPCSFMFQTRGLKYYLKMSFLHSRKRKRNLCLYYWSPSSVTSSHVLVSSTNVPCVITDNNPNYIRSLKCSIIYLTLLFQMLFLVIFKDGCCSYLGMETWTWLFFF